MGIQTKHGLLIDMDGVIYAGEEHIKGAGDFYKTVVSKHLQKFNR